METRHYRNLVVWQRSRDLAVDVFRVTQAPEFRREWGYRDQLRRSALSVPSNIAEGNERGSDRECARFLYFARGSLAEFSTQIEVGEASAILPSETASRWQRQCDEIARMLASLINHRIGRRIS